MKGVIGLGMPTVSLALLSVPLGLPAAVQIMVVPTLVTNVWQALMGDGLWRLLKRFRALLATSVAGIWIGYALLFLANPRAMTAVLGGVLIVYAASGLWGFALMPRIRNERLASPAVGLATGVLAGATGNMSMPAIAYFQALGLPRNDLVQMLGILFSLGALVIGLAVAGYGNYQADMLLVSLIATVPGVAGMLIGQRVRGRLSERGFRRVLFIGLLAVGAHLIWKGLA